MGFQFICLIAFIIAIIPKFSRADGLACPTGCQIPVGKLLFAGSSPEDDYYVATCTNRLRIQSMFLCMKTYCSTDDIVTGLRYFSNECETGGAELLPWSVVDNVTIEDAKSWAQIGIDNLSDETTYDRPVYITSPLFDLSFRTAAYWDHSVVKRANYGYAMFGFFAGVFLIARMAQIVEYLANRQRRPQTRAKSRNETSARRSMSLLLKRFVTVPATFSHRVSEPVGWCTVPQRLQFTTISAFVVVNVVLCCVSYELFEGNLYWPNTRTQLWRYISDRTGVISICNMVLLFTFAMRNDILLWLTGWNFATFNMFHRWVARVATIEAIVHSVGYTIDAFLDGGKAEFVEEWSEQYWWMGAIATCAMSLLLVFSLYPVRKYYYELFLLVHIALAVLFLVGMWYHVAIFDGEYNPYIWACVAVWVFDRFVRICRICCLNLLSLSATATYNADADVIRITVPVRTTFAPKPDTHYYLYGLSGLKPWESHPFTLSTWTSSPAPHSQKMLSFLIRPYDSFTGRLRKQLLNSDSIDSITYTSKIRLMIEGPYGTAHTLTNYNSVLFVVGGSGITVALSHIQALHDAATRSKHHNNDKNTGKNSAMRHLHKIHLVWAVRDRTIFDDVYKHELAAWLTSFSTMEQKIDFQVDVYITRESPKEICGHVEVVNSTETKMDIKSESESSPAVEPHQEALGKDLDIGIVSSTATAGGHHHHNQSLPPASSPTTTSSSIDSSSLEEEGKAGVATGVAITLETSHPCVTITTSRPDILAIVSDAAAANTHCDGGSGGGSGGSNERMAVVSCGPNGMMDDTRAAVVSIYSQGHEEVDFFCESFGW